MGPTMTLLVLKKSLSTTTTIMQVATPMTTMMKKMA